MSDPTSGGFRYVSHLRRGLLTDPQTATSGSFTAAVQLSDGSKTTPVTMQIAGVDAVERFDTTLVSRVYPRDGVTDAETEFFPLIEFSAPELPWLMPTPGTPLGPLPWLCLVVVAVRAGVGVVPGGAGQLDVLRIGDQAKPAEELPDPADSPLWAHAYAATTVRTPSGHPPTDQTPDTPIGGSRLVAARRLSPNTEYLACVVPTLAAGALAGLGRSAEEIAAAVAAPQPKFAWSPADTSVELPVYYSWGFCTGEGADFETLARALQEWPVDERFGTRTLDIGLAGPGMPTTATDQTLFRGALTGPSKTVPPVWPNTADTGQEAVDQAVRDEILRAAQLTAAAHAAGAERPAIGPLLYARAAAGRSDAGADASPADWFEELNRDPRDRGAAGLGTRVLRRNVEDVMARAWQQVGEVRQANEALSRLQASRAVAAALHERHLSALEPGRLIAAARPLLGRVRIDAAASAGQQYEDTLEAVAHSVMPAGATWRGVTALLSPGTRLGLAMADSPSLAAARILESLSRSGIAEPSVNPDGTTSFAAPSAVFGPAAADLATDALRTVAQRYGLPVPAAGLDAAATTTALDQLVTAANQTSANVASRLALQTPEIIGARPLPASLTVAAQGGSLISDPQLKVSSLAAGVAVYSGSIGEAVRPITAEASAGMLGAAAANLSASAALWQAAHPPAARVAGAAWAAGPAGAGTATPLPVAPVTVRPVPITVVPGRVAGPVAGVVGGAVDGVVEVPVAELNPPISAVPIIIRILPSDPRLAVMRDAYAQAVGRFVRPGTATVLPTLAPLDLGAVRTGILKALDPARTMATLAAGRVPAVSGLTRPDPVAPVMVGPVFPEGAYSALAAAGHDAFVPGLDSVPPDSVTLLQTNPAFITAYLAGLNSAMGHELMWRGYPTDERGTYWYSFWGARPDIGPLHQFSGTLASNLLSGSQPQLVLVLRGRLLRHYPDADIYAVKAGTDKDVPELDDGTLIQRPLFRVTVQPGMTFVGFDLALADVLGTAATGSGEGYWFVIAEHPGQPRFGLIDPDPAAPHPPLPSWNELSWDDLGPGGQGAVYAPRSAPPMKPTDGSPLTWGTSAAAMAAITYQPAVRVALRARDLLRSSLQ